MAPQKDSASPCVWYSSHNWSLIKAKCQNKPSKTVPLTAGHASHCTTDTNDYIKVPRSASSLLTHGLLSQPPSACRGELVVSKGLYWAIPPYLQGEGIWGEHDYCRIQDVPSCRGGCKKTLTVVAVFIHILPEAPALRWNLNVVMLWGALSPWSAEVSCSVHWLLLRSVLCALHTNYWPFR